MNKIIFHIDVNSAFLSWDAVDRLNHGEKIDLRKIPSIVGGNPINRHGIVLAKSIPAKKYGIKTAQTLVEAYRLCPNLVSVPPRYHIYTKASRAMMKLLREYSPNIEIYSIDECFLDYTNMKKLFASPIEAAYMIKKRLYDELGFTVNVGVSSNKILAKMASDFLKPDRVHTLFIDEIEEKMWPLDVSKLFMAGRSSVKKLRKYGINTIGELAKSDLSFLKHILKSHGELIYNFANGIDDSKVGDLKYSLIKSIGNSTTISYDVTSEEDAYKYLLSLSESVGMRLRAVEKRAKVVVITIKTNEFIVSQKQKKLFETIVSTNEIYREAKRLFDLLWDKKPIRLLGVRVVTTEKEPFKQLSFFENKKEIKLEKLDNTLDELREKYGKDIILRATFLRGKVKPITGGVSSEDDYPKMRSQL
ncbi:DNA polymerase Y family protein [Helicovermis profundi]|uniref:DNA polymerase IV n=1 Tax=Helicovermis profundi TaxID=3065157 RepID=A0AAU9EIA4_9FIRM|nr:DNA polymerase IV [Clostridia bacterium S502]